MRDLYVSAVRDVLTYCQLDVCAGYLEVCNPVTLRKEHRLTVFWRGGGYASEEHSSISV